jgi:hypothetical protein
MSEVALEIWTHAAKAFADGSVDCRELDEADEEIDVLR